MPLARPVLLFLCCVAIPTFLTFFSLISAHPRQHAATESSPAPERGGIRSFLSFHTPSSLFPPSAIISLTDDNSTFFLARPADFGPELTSKGLSGQLWVGSGFGDDNRRKGGAALGAEGELGCSDVPGWEDDQKPHRGHSNLRQSGRMLSPATGGEASSNILADNPAQGVQSEHLKISGDLLSDDGTDNHLQHPLPESQISKSLRTRQSEKRKSSSESPSAEHADIQSLQETAEITGKVALLSRGGCGFLEKVKWAQRRGAAALIVGDDTRGGALVTMYARGDTSNITIPSLFTSHTTAHLLSSLIPPEGYPDDGAEDGDDTDISHGNKGHESAEQDTKLNVEIGKDRPTFTPSAPRPKVTSASLSGGSVKRKPLFNKVIHQDSKLSKKSSWIRSLFGRSNKAEGTGLEGDTRRPPSSGRLNWINEPWSEELLAEKKAQKSSTQSLSNSKARAGSKAGSQHNLRDGFEIGIQDWRDPDLVMTKASQGKTKDVTEPKAAMPTGSLTDHRKEKDASNSKGVKALSGGSITPGSGEYRTPGHSIQASNGAQGDFEKAMRLVEDANRDSDAAVEDSWISRVLWGDDSDEKKLRDDLKTDDQQGNSAFSAVKARLQKPKAVTDSSDSNGEEDHDGLWVTLTPASMSTTPFFDTLLVLVVSPLITLTVVYALLLIRSRMRRRRWRAPKSVVEQLPVRTYQTMSCSSTTTSTRLASPLTSSPTSPLLQSHSRPAVPRSRPRSRTASSIEEAVSASLDKATAKAVAKQEKPLRKYKGKQIECVVCLEEYIEGHSQVMSLPCGHEFHADCM